MTARERNVDAVRRLLDKHATLYDAAAATTGARPIAGRGTAYAIPVDGEEWLVRHYRRGGAVAPILGDRYAALGDRALHELNVSAAARARGIATPEVIAAISYRSGLFSRHDLATVFIPNARDLAQLLFEERIAGPEEIARASLLITRMIRLGLVHADLNLKNILVTPTTAYVLDLDRCTLIDQPSKLRTNAMKRRFLRSLDKWESRTGRIVADSHHAALEAAFHV